jgi:hypothetical protein
MTVATLTSPTGRTCEIPLDDTPITQAALRANLISLLNLPTQCPLVFRDGQVVRFGPVPNAGGSTFAFISKAEFPDKSYPNSDYSFLFDHLRFPSHPPVEDFHDPNPPNPAKDDDLRDLVGDVSRQVAARPARDVQDGDVHPPSHRGNGLRIHRPVSMTEEEDGEELLDEEPDEEEDIDESLYIHDDYDDTLGPEVEEPVARLAALGIDKSVCRWIYRANGHNEEAAYRAMAPIAKIISS